MIPAIIGARLQRVDQSQVAVAKELTGQTVHVAKGKMFELETGTVDERTQDTPYCMVIDSHLCKENTGHEECILPVVSQAECEKDSGPGVAPFLQGCHQKGTCHCKAAVEKTQECSKAPPDFPGREVNSDGKSYCCEPSTGSTDLETPDTPYCMVIDSHVCKENTGHEECILPVVSQAECENDSGPGVAPFLQGCHQKGTCHCKAAVEKTDECSKAPPGFPGREVNSDGQSYCCEP
jgi:hypothetical protein